MTRAEWLKAPKNEKKWSNYNKARKHFPLCRMGRIVVLHHKNPFCTNYEEWNIDELVPVFLWCHTALHNEINAKNIKDTFIGNRKGKKHTEETRHKMAESHTGLPWSAIRREAYLQSDYQHSDETKAKLSAIRKAHPGHVFTDEERKKMSLAHKKRGTVPPSQLGVVQSEETRRKISESLKRFYESHEGIEKKKWYSEQRSRRGKKAG